ncbi:hypothetical protein SK128_025035 [Halocaridina rubra]|uniref:N-acetyltransferase domain-containing protein n=1 Tax=Halocaridina rubra TaxID=373956 RepID=A0AAN8XJH3_HALRR
MKNERGHILIRRLRETDTDEVRRFCRNVQSRAAKEQLWIQICCYFRHPFLYSVITGTISFFYFAMQLNVVSSLSTAICLIALTEGIRFQIFWSKIRGVFGEGQDLQNLFKYYSDSRRIFLVAMLNGQIVGTVAVRETPEKNVAKLFRMFVHRDYRRMGLASRLISASHEECKRNGYTSVIIRTHTTNVKAIKCYEKAGYLPTEVYNFARLYPHTFNAVSYVKENS